MLYIFGKECCYIKFNLLVIDKDNEMYLQQKTAWEKHNITLTRTFSVQEAIQAIKGKEYYFVAINADNINYESNLQILRDSTEIPIFICTSKYVHEKHVKALQLGADLYTEWHETREKGIACAMALAQRCYERINYTKSDLVVLKSGDICIYPDYRLVYINNEQLQLLDKEFMILQCLVISKGKVVTHESLSTYVWGIEYADLPRSVIHTHIGRIRKKLNELSSRKDYIKTIRNIGYKLVIYS